MGVAVRMLGPLEVELEGRLVAVAGARERALLGRLALSAGAPVSSLDLTAFLWGPRPPADPVAALQVHVSRVRKVLRSAGAAELVRTRPGAYLLAVPREAVDALRFADAVERGRAHARRGEPQAAAQCLRDALALWRGTALADLEADARVHAPELVALEEARLAALEARIEADIACGRHAALVPELQALVARHPYREGLTAALMLALYRCGRQAEALEAYRTLRRVLGDDLGLRPAARLRLLEQAVLRQDAALDEVKAPAGPVALAVRLTDRAGGGTVVGREPELARLTGALSAAAAGSRGRIVLVAGDPGIGKTTLAAAFAAQAGTAGPAGRALALYGRCEEGLGLPYQPFAEAVGDLVPALPETVLRAHLERYGPWLGVLAPGLGDRLGASPAPDTGDPASDRFRLFSAVAGVLGAAGRPLAVLLDDLHWADRGTLALLRYLAGNVPPGVLLVGLYRPGELAANPAFAEVVRRLRKEPGTEVIDLRGLDAAAAAALVEAVAEGRLDPLGSEEVERLRSYAGGNPFYLRQLVRHRAEHGKGVVPLTVREVVADRAARLGPVAARVLAAAAVLGVDVDADEVAAVSGEGAEAVLGALSAACDATLMHELGPSRFSFVHAIVAGSLHDGLTATRRADLHRRAARLLAGDGGSAALAPAGADGVSDQNPRIAEIAGHRLASHRPADAAATLAATRAAGDRALTTLAFEDAVRWFAAALRVADECGLEAGARTDLQIRLGHAQRLAGDPAARDTLLAAARAARHRGDGRRLVAAALVNSRGAPARAGVPDLERIELLEAACAAAEPGSSQRACLLATLLSEMSEMDDWPRRRALGDEALALARALGDPVTTVRVITMAWWGLAGPQSLAERLALTAEAVELAEASCAPIEQHWARRLHMYGCMEAADLCGVDAQLEAVVRLAAAVQDPHTLWASGFIRTFRATLAGDLATAEDWAGRTLEIGRDGGQPDAPVAWAVSMLEVRAQQGRYDEVRAVLADLAAAAGEGPPAPMFAAFGARLYALAGDLAPAAAILTACGDFRALPYSWNYVTTLTMFAEAAVAVQDAQAASTLYDLLLPWRAHLSFMTAFVHCAVELSLGELAATLGRRDQAREHLHRSLLTHRRIGAPYWAGRSLLALAAVEDDPAVREKLVAEAASLAERHGLVFGGR